MGFFNFRVLVSHGEVYVQCTYSNVAHSHINSEKSTTVSSDCENAIVYHRNTVGDIRG